MARDEVVSVGNGGLRLEGSYRHAEAGAFPVSVLLIAGSGEHDRNQNTGKMKLGLFDALAAQLSDAGVSTLRYDKRGCGASEGDYLATGQGDLVSDAIAWYDLMRDELAGDGARCLVLGHSEGTVIAPQVAAQRTSVAGQILLMPFLERFSDMIRRQLDQSLSELSSMKGVQGLLARTTLALSGNPAEQQRRLLARLRSTSETTFRQRFRKVNAKWLREFDELDPEAVHARVAVPTLAIAGEKDLQCRPEDARRLASLSPSTVTAVTLSDLTHILRIDREQASLSRYPQLLAEPIDPRIAEHIVRWLRASGTREAGRSRRSSSSA